MIAEVRTKSQITIPKKIIDSLKINVGDMVDIVERDGMICIIPVVVYPKSYINELHNQAIEMKQNIAEGKAEVFDNVDSLFSALDA